MHMHKNRHAHAHMNRQANKTTREHTRAQTHTHTNTDTHTDTNKQTNIQTQTYTQTQTNTNTHKHTHTHTDRPTARLRRTVLADASSSTSPMMRMSSGRSVICSASMCVHTLRSTRHIACSNLSSFSASVVETTCTRGGAACTAGRGADMHACAPASRRRFQTQTHGTRRAVGGSCTHRMALHARARRKHTYDVMTSTMRTQQGARARTDSACHPQAGTAAQAPRIPTASHQPSLWAAVAPASADPWRSWCFGIRVMIFETATRPPAHTHHGRDASDAPNAVRHFTPLLREHRKRPLRAPDTTHTTPPPVSDAHARARVRRGRRARTRARMCFRRSAVSRRVKSSIESVSDLLSYDVPRDMG
jgi:hypothetical protein